MTVFNKHIKRISKFTENSALEKELNNILAQVPHRDDILYKNDGITKKIEYSGTGKLTIEVVNGQITKIEITGE